MNMTYDYQKEKESRKNRLLKYAEEIQKNTHEMASQTIRELVEERHRQNLTQQEIADRTGIIPSNLARLESGARIPTLVVLEKYAEALGKHIEFQICDGTGTNDIRG